MTESLNPPAARQGDTLPPHGPPSGNFVQIGATQTLFPGSAEDARAQFRRFHAISIGNILDPGLLATVQRVCSATQFGAGMTTSGEAEKIPGLREVELSPQPVGRLLNLALERPVFLRWLEDVTGCEPLGSVRGGLTQTPYHPGYELRWHDDYQEEGRRLAIVINLGTEPYEGGEFAIRPKGGEIIFEHKYTELGSALIFEVNRSLEHRVKPLTAGGPRRVFAGWAIRPGIE